MQQGPGWWGKLLQSKALNPVVWRGFPPPVQTQTFLHVTSLEIAVLPVPPHSVAPGLLLKPSQPWLGLSEVIRTVIYPRLNLPARECLQLGNLAGNIGTAAPAGF